MTRALLLALCACNDVYGLAPTQLLDGRPIDAPARCESSALVFSPRVQQIVFRACRDYSFAGERAVAVCGSSFGNTIGEGTVNGELVDAPIDVTTTVDIGFAQPRMTPEGELIVIKDERLSQVDAPSVFERKSTGWTWKYDLPFLLGAGERVGAPSRGPQRHLIISRANGIDEAIDDGSNNWTTKAQPASSLGVSSMSGAFNLSSDGLRAVFATPDGVRYTVRDRIDTPFAGSFPLDVPPVTDPFLTEDCSRLYFSGLDSVFYVQR